MVFDVSGTTLTTPRPCRSTDALAPSLDTITAGLTLLASLPLTGSRSTM